MKKIISTSLIIIFVITGFQAFSQDKKAETILKELSAKTKASKSIRTEFTYTLVNKSVKKHEVRDGTLLSKGDKYKLSIAGQIVISDGKTVWTYIKDANEVQINSVGEDEDAFTPTKILESYTENYKSKFIEEKKLEGKTLQVIDMVPLKRGKSFSKVQLTLDKVRKQLFSFAVFNKDGSTYTYKIKKYITDQPIAESEFIFKASNYPGVEIIDMR